MQLNINGQKNRRGSIKICKKNQMIEDLNVIELSGKVV